jgi:hypothetical protein
MVLEEHKLDLIALMESPKILEVPMSFIKKHLTLTIGHGIVPIIV